MNVRHRTALLTSITITSALALSACGGADGGAVANEADPVAINVTVVAATEAYGIPWLVGDEKGLFKKRGVDIGDIVSGAGGTATLRSLVSGELAIGEVGLPAVIQARVAGTPVTVVGGATRSPYPLDFYAKTDGPVKTIADAKKWAFSNPGSPSESLTYLLPQGAGISPDAVERVASGGPGEGVALLDSGAVDVALVPPALVSRNPGKYRLIASSAEFLPAFQQTVLTVQDSYLEKNPTVISAVVAGYQDAVEYVEQNPEEAAALYAKESGIEVSAARTQVDSALKVENWSAGLDSPALTAAADAMKVAGFKGDVPWCELFNLEFIPAEASRQLPVPCGR